MKLTMIAAIGILVAAAGCKTTQSAADNQSGAQPVVQDAPQPTTIEDKPMAYIPKAVAYKTNGDYNDNVAVTIDRNGRILSFPDPSDVSAESSALPLADGWLLDRRGGIGDNTAFLRYTYAEYAKLPAVPTLDQLRAATIPGARVTAVKQLPLTYSQAIADPAKAAALLK